MKPPEGLGPRGRALWRSIVRALPDGLEFDERECALLRLAARQSDDLAALEAEIERLGPTVTGSMQQPVLNPCVAEARQARLAILRLLGQLSLPDEDEEPRSASSRQAKHAAQVRWMNEPRRRATP